MRLAAGQLEQSLGEVDRHHLSRGTNGLRRRNRRGASPTGYVERAISWFQSKPINRAATNQIPKGKRGIIKRIRGRGVSRSGFGLGGVRRGHFSNFDFGFSNVAELDRINRVYRILRSTGLS